MNELINNLLKYKDDYNSKICLEVVDYIKRYEINSLEDLKNSEMKRYTILNPYGNIKMTDEEIIANLFDDSNSCEEDKINCSFVDKREADLLKSEILNIDNIDLRFINLIKIYSLYNWDMVLPYHAYEYIVGSRI